MSSGKPFRLAVRAVILDGQRRCLLVRRSNACKAFVGTWEWPGGKLDDGETFDAGLLREVREETGLEIELRGVVGAFGFEMANARMAVLCMEAQVAGGEFRSSEEHDDFAWVAPSEMAGFELTPGAGGVALGYARQAT